MPTLEELFPVALLERSLRFPSTETNPAHLLRTELARMAGAHRDECDLLLGAMAVASYQLSHLLTEAVASGAMPLHDRLEIVQANLFDVLQQHGVEIRDLTGQPILPNDQPWVDVRGHRINPELTEPSVWHMEQPIVFRQGRCLLRGVVILETPPRSG